MDTFHIHGGKSLKGTVRVSGAKNAVLPIMAASLLADGPVEIAGVPRLRDVATFGRLLGVMGAAVECIGDGGGGGDVVRVDPREAVKAEAPYDLVKTMRASVLVLGPLVARRGRARISLPGGCAIGARPIDQHIKGLEILGAKTTLSEGYIEAEAAGRLRGGVVHFDVKTVTGTENLMMAAALASGTTVLKNAALEPEVCDLARALRAMGADIEGEGTDEIVVRGVPSLSGARHTVMADRIEAATILLAGAITGGDVTAAGADPASMGAVLDKIAESGAEVTAAEGQVRVRRDGPVRSVNVNTSPYPGFPTDVQAQFMAYMCLGDGFSIIRETIFENRFMHVAELRRMGAQVDISGNTAAVKGVPGLSGAPCMATDLRASASLVLAGLAASGTTEILRIYHLDRGYEALETKLSALGADIARVQE